MKLPKLSASKFEKFAGSELENAFAIVGGVAVNSYNNKTFKLDDTIDFTTDDRIHSVNGKGIDQTLIK